MEERLLQPNCSRIDVRAEERENFVYPSYMFANKLERIFKVAKATQNSHNPCSLKMSEATQSISLCD